MKEITKRSQRLKRKSVNLDGNKHRLRTGTESTDFKKAALTELKGEKSRICCLFWMLIVIGSETKKSLDWFLKFRWGVEVEVFMRRVKLLFGSILLQLTPTTGSPTSNLCKHRAKFLKIIKGAKHHKVVDGSLLCSNTFITHTSLCSDKQLNILICNE